MTQSLAFMAWGCYVGQNDIWTDMMGELVYKEGKHPHCDTAFGTYWAGFTNHPIYSDIGDTHGEPYRHVTVYWSKLDSTFLYIGFSASDAFATMENDFQTRKLERMQMIIDKAFGCME